MAIKKPDNLNFLEHLGELRLCLIKSLVFFVFSCLLVYPYTGRILFLLIRPVGFLVFTAPQEAFMAHFKVMLGLAVFVSMPFILYQVWKFVAAGFSAKERNFLRVIVPLSAGLFFAGAVFAFFFIIPIAFRFFLSFTRPFLQPMITVESYISFIFVMMFAFGAAFELPLAMGFLARLGVITPAFLITKRRHAIVVIFIISAILTPPDCASQILMAVPLMILYELGILLSRMVSRRVQKETGTSAE